MKRLSLPVSMFLMLAIPALTFAAVSRQETQSSRSPTETKETPVQTQDQGEEAGEGLVCAPVPVPTPVPVRKCAQADCGACKNAGDCNSQPGCIWTGTTCT